VYLVDTSAWIEVFRKGSRITVDDLVDDRDAILTCLPVVQEVLQGFDDERAFQIARTAMLALPCVEVPVTLALTERAVDIYRRTRRIGLTVRSSVDCLIAACAARHHLTVVHRDRDFAAIAKVVPLEHIDIAARPRR
jgi:predicted nucleic acid-binding protein